MRWFIVSLWIFLISDAHAHRSKFLRHQLPTSSDTKCLDGSTAGFYYRAAQPSNADSERYLIYLQPGGFCHNIATCRRRCDLAPFLCTSPQSATPASSSHHGIISEDKDINPHFHDYHTILVPYCSGDMYIGSHQAGNQTGGYHFMGRTILKAIVHYMTAMTSMASAKTVVLAGSSAGGAGVVFNCDDVASMLPDVTVRCVVDGAFFYPDIAPFRSNSDCESIQSVLQQGAHLWNAPQIINFRPQSDTWWLRIQQPVFIVTAAVDQFGFESNCGSHRNSNDVTIWVNATQDMVEAFFSQKLLDDVTATGVFMPACYDHMLLLDDVMYSKVKVGDIGLTLNQALDVWMQGQTVHLWDKCDISNVLCNQYCGNIAITYQDMQP